MKTTHKSLIWLVAALLMVAAGMAFTVWSYQQIENASNHRKHSRAVISAADDFFSALKDAETGQRGYAVTGDEAYLQPYLAVRNKLSENLKALRQITDIAQAQTHLDKLAPLLDAKLAEMAKAIVMRRNHDTLGVLAQFNSGEGKRLMDAIRAEVRQFAALQVAAQVQHDALFDQSMRRLLTIIVCFGLLAMLFALYFSYANYRAAQQRVKNQIHLETQHLLEVQTDINRQLQDSNRSLQDSEQKLAVTLNSIGDAVIATDAQARVTMLNPIAEHLTGWTQALAQGRFVDEIFHIINKETRQPATIPVADALAHGTIQGLANHTVLVARDGREFDIADSCAPIRSTENQVVGAVLVFRNVTEEYAVQQTLRDSAALVQTILNTVVDGIATIHAQGGIIESVNPAIEHMFGYTAAELNGKGFGLLIPELDQDQHNVSLAYYGASAEARAVGVGREVMGRRKNGSVFPLEIAVSEMLLGDVRHRS